YIESREAFVNRQQRVGSRTICLKSIVEGGWGRDVLVNAIHRERHIVSAGAISIKNMEAGGIAYRRFRACQPKCWGEGNSWCSKQIPPLQRRHAAFWCAVFFDCK